MTLPKRWTLDHRPQITHQTEATPGEADINGHSWIERRLTGYGTATCSCGYTTGLIPTEQLPAWHQLLREHPPFGRPDTTAEGSEQT